MEANRLQVVTLKGTIVEISSADRAAIIAELRRWEASRHEISHYLVLGAFENVAESGLSSRCRRRAAMLQIDL
jgi:hypothetical protein